MSEMSKLAMVEFVEEKSVEVVPLLWTEGSSKKIGKETTIEERGTGKIPIETEAKVTALTEDNQEMDNKDKDEAVKVIEVHTDINTIDAEMTEKKNHQKFLLLEKLDLVPITSGEWVKQKINFGGYHR
ncbi:uncharacterized protein LOC106467311 [Limulus polyphemus]|uniref:Uncharacterized protein LOC106467311 n=1 Tax=Limulus polyphemus TaxID=6850 RepID=A0ABM1T5M5_LIMPO|nr:uncharacterized protein LOC106467311 [Limulus polyphemus]XP_022251181.1 uncharacterized protein LOC106467311 [Limulus polyphemus]